MQNNVLWRNVNGCHHVTINGYSTERAVQVGIRDAELTLEWIMSAGCIPESDIIRTDLSKELTIFEIRGNPYEIYTFESGEYNEGKNMSYCCKYRRTDSEANAYYHDDYVRFQKNRLY